MEINYLFDIDGTLTPVQQRINPEFEKWFLDWQKGKNVYLVTGNDYQKVINQLGDGIVKSISGIFCCSGNHHFKHGIDIYQSSWKPSKDLLDKLNANLRDSNYPKRFGNHIEIRIGMINFSIVGRNSTKEERRAYFEWDKKSKEREKIAKKLRSEFSDLDIQIGGEISMDISEKGKDKSQVVDYFKSPIYFFGDKICEGGNDEKIAKAIINPESKVFPVYSWEETWDILKKL